MAFSASQGSGSGHIPGDEIRIGAVPRASGWTKFGYRTGLTAANGEETVWAASGNFTPLESADTFDIAYDGTAGGSTDGSGTAGALTLYFQYIDSDGNPAISVHTLGTDGTDTTSFSGLGINRIAVSSSGSADVNQGAITVTATSGGSTQAYIPAGEGVTQQAIYFSGISHDAVAKMLWVNIGKPSGGNAKVTVKGYVFNRPVTTNFEVFRVLVDTTNETTIKISDPVGFLLSPGDVLYFVADTDTNNATVNVRFSLVEYERGV